MASYLDILAPLRIPGKDDRRVGARAVARSRTACICHDIEVLLNTRRADTLADGTKLEDAYPELATSGFGFGIRDQATPDILIGTEWSALADHIAKVIATFEPRLTDIDVRPRPSPTGANSQSDSEKKDAVRLVIEFEITARLLEPGGTSSHAEFVSEFKRGTGRYDVKIT